MNISIDINCNCRFLSKLLDNSSWNEEESCLDVPEFFYIRYYKERREEYDNSLTGKELRIWRETLNAKEKEVKFDSYLLALEESEWSNARTVLFEKCQNENLRDELIWECDAFIKFLREKVNGTEIVERAIPKELNNEKAITLLNRLVSAGLCKDIFTWNKDVTGYQIAEAAYLIGLELGIPQNRRWAPFTELWQIKYLSQNYQGANYLANQPKIKVIDDLFPEGLKISRRSR